MATASVNISEAVELLRRGEVIAYPTEAVFGLGCDPHDHAVVSRLLEIKSRPESAGLILIADDFSRFDSWIDSRVPVQLERIHESWPGPVTWLFPKANAVPAWISGQHDSVALRVTAHPVCRELCAAFGGPIVSTSANRSGQPPARTPGVVRESLGDDIAGIVTGEIGEQLNPSEIRDARTGNVLRPG